MSQIVQISPDRFFQNQVLQSKNYTDCYIQYLLHIAAKVAALVQGVRSLETRMTRSCFKPWNFKLGVRWVGYFDEQLDFQDGFRRSLKKWKLRQFRPCSGTQKSAGSTICKLLSFPPSHFLCWEPSDLPLELLECVDGADGSLDQLTPESADCRWARKTNLLKKLSASEKRRKQLRARCVPRLAFGSLWECHGRFSGLQVESLQEFAHNFVFTPMRTRCE